MALYKQLSLIISFLIIVLISIIMVTNYKYIKQNTVNNFYNNSSNNISLLAKKLANINEDTALLINVIDSEFENTNYKVIDFKSNDHKSDYTQIKQKTLNTTPSWFINLINIQVKDISIELSNGTLIVEIDTTNIYKTLYEIFIQLIYIYIVSIFITLSILFLVLHYLLKPLKLVQNQAASIVDNKFIIQENIPSTLEFRNLVHGMNAMINKIEETFNKANIAIQKNKELLYNDSITKLYNRRYLILKLPDLLILENKINGGSIMLLSITGAQVINQEIGRKKTDQFFLELAQNLLRSCNHIENSLVARVHPTEFILMLPDCDSNEANNIVLNINKYFRDVLNINKLSPFEVKLNIGIYRYKPSVSIGELLSRVDNALLHAKAKHKDNVYLHEDEENKNAIGKEKWRQILDTSIENNLVSLRFWPTINTKEKKLHHEVMTFIIDIDEEEKYFYGDFIASTIELGLTSKIYLCALQNLMQQRHEELDNTKCSIRLSTAFMHDKNSFNELSSLFSKFAKTIKFKLIFEVSDSFAINYPAQIKSYALLFNKYDFDFGINSFSGEAKDFSYLQGINPSFIKADSTFLLDQSVDSISALQVITDSLGIDIVATFVKTKESLSNLEKMNITIVQGPITDTIVLV